MAGSGKGFLAEFKEFISRGNVVDMAVGVVVGSAFTGIVNSLVKDVMMPAIGFLIGGVDFADLKIVLAPAVGETPEVAVLYGTFLNQIVNFLILAFVVFVMDKLSKPAEPESEKAPEPTKEEVLLTEIRDLLKEREGK